MPDNCMPNKPWRPELNRQTSVTLGVVALIVAATWTLATKPPDNVSKLAAETKEPAFVRVDWDELVFQVDELYRLHDQRDADGVPVWYVRRSLEEAMKQLANNIAAQTEVLRDFGRDMKELRKTIDSTAGG